MKGIIKVIMEPAYLVCLSLDLAFDTALQISKTVQYREFIFYINFN